MKIKSNLFADASLQEFWVNRSTLEARFITPVKNRFTNKAKNIFCLVSNTLYIIAFTSERMSFRRKRLNNGK
jgi:hypothetical protein